MESIDDARAFAERLVMPLGRRWLHVRGVADRAQEIASAVDPAEAPILIAAAWLHDIGYAPEIARTKFHPLDGARHLRESGWNERLVCLVAHHSGARFEAVERGLSDQLREYPCVEDPVLDALATADLTTSPDGEATTYDERIREILSRYESDDPVHRTWTKAAPIMREAIERTERRLAEAHPK